MKNISLNVPDEWYSIIHDKAQKEGQRDDEYVLRVLQSNLDINQSYVQKNSAHQAVKGSDIINNGNLVLLNGIFYNYRLQGQLTDGRVKDIDPHATYLVVGLNGNQAVLAIKN